MHTRGETSREIAATRVHYDERTNTIGATSRPTPEGRREALRFVFYKDIEIGPCIALRVYIAEKRLKTPDWRIELVRKEQMGNHYVAIRKGHPDYDAPQLRFIEPELLMDAIFQLQQELEAAVADPSKQPRPKVQPARRPRPRHREPLKTRIRGVGARLDEMIRVGDETKPRERMQEVVPHRPIPMTPSRKDVLVQSVLHEIRPRMQTLLQRLREVSV